MKRPNWAPSSKGAGLCWLLIFIVALGTLAARVPRLKMRPMHTDEAVHAAKFADVLEAGEYEYDPNEYHGPTLNYFTLIPAWFGAQRTYPEITEVTLRIVPVVFSIILILLTLFWVNDLGPAAVVVAILAALSPAMCFYSRYYIQEMLLVCFTFGLMVAGFRYARSGLAFWAAIAGLFAGLMHATKETCIIAFGALVLAWMLTAALGKFKHQGDRKASSPVRVGHCILGIVVAVVVSGLLCSAFLQRPGAIVDSYRTYLGYLSQGSGQDTVHIHPWYYYLKMLAFSQYADGPIWSEGCILVLALVGLVVAIRPKSVPGVDPALARFLAFYTVAMTVVYSALSYKTPWCLLSFLHGMIFLAGLGVAGLWVWIRSPLGRGLVVALLVVTGAHLAVQCYRGSFVYESDNRNPYVYAHTTDEIFLVTEKVVQYAATTELGSAAVPIQVACSGADYWPLPWYFRSLHVVYRSAIPDHVGPLILISADLKSDLTRRLYQETPVERRQMYMYVLDDPYYASLRPQVQLYGFVSKSLWDAYNRGPDPIDLIEKTRERETEKTGDDVRQQ